jgi:ketosteroid isomerase-like protein
MEYIWMVTMNYKIQLLIALSLPAALLSRAQPTKRQRLEEVHKEIANAYLHHDAAALLRIYAIDAVSMPEYHPTLFGKKAIAAYIGQWMDSARVEAYARKTYDVTKAGNYLVETGTFSNKFSPRERAVDYEGKYIDIWRLKSDGGLQLVLEITGSTKNIDRSDLPLSAFQILDTAILSKPAVTASSLAIQSLNDQVASLVVHGRGKEFAQYYADDAIYMPYYSPLLVGKAALDAWYRQHEDPNTKISAVHIGATRLIDVGTYVLENAYYKVDWPGGDPRTSVTGKNITIWKRDHSGHLLVFRQMTVHD